MTKRDQLKARKKKKRTWEPKVLILPSILIALLLLLAYQWYLTRQPAPAPAQSSAPSLSVGDLVKTASGLQYEDLVAGDGAEAVAGKTVTVHYTGWLTDGTQFDSSLDRGQPFEFLLGAGAVIPGWDEGLQGMKVGGKRRLVIPPDLAYGSQAVGGVIPANSTLIFKVELISVQ
jgi:FKBP-type peptidyl-prolyl cis-trans isomerase FkpA